MFKKVCIGLLLILPITLIAQEKHEGDIYDPSFGYQAPEDPLTRKNLKEWQDLKFGLILHWGLYSEAGISESWPLCGEPWTSRDTTMSYENFKKWYWKLSEQFNPLYFSPEKWAVTSRTAGIKYLIFTTKHHDGFNMFDTKYSDFKITNGPFANNERADVTKHIFDAFRKEGIKVGVYFSKPDWYSQDFWWDRFPTANRNINYNTYKFPERYQRYRDFTYNQLTELMNNYGKIDILWLDGGWIHEPHEGEMTDPIAPHRNGVARYPAYPQAVDMPKIAEMARKAQPGILLVDRTIQGPYENYQTPEQHIPETQMNIPWEACITLTCDWSYRKKEHEKVKSSAWIIHTLAEIVAKGGNFLMGFGPTPLGEFPEEVEQPLYEAGKWLEQNGEAIYGTTITEHYNDGATWFTQSKDGETIYAIVCIKEGEKTPPTLSWRGNVPDKKAKIISLATNKPVKWHKQEDNVIITLPASLSGKQTQALAFAYQTSKK